MNTLIKKLNLKQIIFIFISIIAFSFMLAYLIDVIQEITINIYEVYPNKTDEFYQELIYDLTKASKYYAIIFAILFVYFSLFLGLGIKKFFISKEKNLLPKTLLIYKILLIILLITTSAITLHYISIGIIQINFLINLSNTMGKIKDWYILLIDPSLILFVYSILLWIIIEYFIKIQSSNHKNLTTKESL